MSIVDQPETAAEAHWREAHRKAANDLAALQEKYNCLLDAIEEPPKWRSMESAPLDGTLILLRDGDEPPAVCFWIEARGEWVVRWDFSEYDIEETTTWMPLPTI